MEEEIKKDDVQVNKEISKEELKPTNKKKIIFNFILILTIFLGLLIYMIQVDGIDNIINLNEKVNFIMNSNPKTINQNENQSKALEIMKKYRLKHLPVVDQEKKIVGIKVLDDLLDILKLYEMIKNRNKYLL